MQLLNQSKMASMGEMIGNIAHQWRQPLGAISISLSTLKTKKDLDLLDDKSFDQSIKTITDSIQYLSNTIDTFRNFLKENKSYIHTTIQDRINKTIEIVGAAIKDQYINININMPSEDIPIKIIEGELPQVLINILNNAKDILVEKSIEDPNIYIEVIKKEKIIQITIEDNGGGIPEDILPKVFDPYFTTKHMSQGTGIGLYMSYKIMTESLKGKLYAQNTSKGAKFFIDLPLHRDNL